MCDFDKALPRVLLIFHASSDDLYGVSAAKVKRFYRQPLHMVNKYNVQCRVQSLAPSFIAYLHTRGERCECDEGVK